MQCIALTGGLEREDGTGETAKIAEKTDAVSKTDRPQRSFLRIEADCKHPSRRCSCARNVLGGIELGTPPSGITVKELVSARAVPMREAGLDDDLLTTVPEAPLPDDAGALRDVVELATRPENNDFRGTRI